MLANKFKGVVVSKLTYDEIKNIKFIHTIFSEEQIKKRIAEIGAQITNDYKDKEKDGIVVVSVLKGAVIFMADLVRAIDLNCEIDFMAASSYHNSNKSSGRLKIEKDVSEDLQGKHVIIAEDIVDTGLTLEYISNMFKNKGAASVKICAFLNKNVAKSDVDIAYTCFDCPNEFIVGYGLDYAQQFRTLPYVSSVEV